jgi:hypothetical protein
MDNATQPDVSRSNALARDFLANADQRARKTQLYRHLLPVRPAKVFAQLCPTRECDWIDGWTCTLLYTQSGYAEDKCIFSTDASNGLGPGLWIFTQYVPDRRVALVRLINDHLVKHMSIELEDNGDGTTTSVWTLTFTALTAIGDGIVNGLPDQDAGFQRVLQGLDAFLGGGGN